jgi:iduronate 2-sulfatase
LIFCFSYGQASANSLSERFVHFEFGERMVEFKNKLPGASWLVAVVVALLGVLSPSRVLSAATHYDVYLLAGQSNMDGRGKAKDLPADQRAPSPAIIFYRNPSATSDGWKPLAPGYSVSAGYKGPIPSRTFGPEIGFAGAMLKAQPDHPLALIKGSKGGTSLAKDWKPGTKDKPDTQGPCYRHFVETIQLAFKELESRGDTYTIAGLLWHQGESDAHSTAEVYQEQLTTLIGRFREEVGQPELPVVVGEVFDNGKRDPVRAAQKAVATSVPHVGFASSDGLTTWDGGTHFDAASQLSLGQRFAEATMKLQHRPPRTP